MRIHITPEIGRIRLAKLKPHHLQRLYAQKLAEGLSPTTVNAIHVVLNRALRQALRWELVPQNVAALVDPPRPVRPKPNPLTTDEITRFRSAVVNHRHRNFWELLLTTGMRFGEAAALQWTDVDLAGRSLMVRHTLTRSRGRSLSLAEPKTPQSRRVVPLPKSAVLALERQRIQNREMQLLSGGRWNSNDWAFPSTVGTPLREAHVLKAFHRVLERTGIDKHRMHDLRSSYATNLAALGHHPRVAQQLLGHGRTETTMLFYTAVVPSALRDAADSLDANLPDLAESATDETLAS